MFCGQTNQYFRSFLEEIDIMGSRQKIRITPSGLSPPVTSPKARSKALFVLAPLMLKVYRDIGTNF